MHRFVTVALVLLVLFRQRCLASTTPPLVNLQPNCSIGIQGFWKGFFNLTNSSVAEFLGVPYAAPVGERRWTSPQLRTCPGSDGNVAYDASFMRPVCPQPFALNSSEDCLHLNIYVPQAAYEARTKSCTTPVLVYFHGGDLVFGSGNESPFDYFVANLAVGDMPLIALTVNYRLGVLGFLASEALLGELNDEILGNYGIQDQLVALQWIQANICSFGGDPKQVSIMGQSSGGTSVLALRSSPSSTGLFRAALVLSGSPNITMGRAEKLAQDAEIVAGLGCDHGVAKDIAACLRNQSTSAVLNAMPNSWNLNAEFALGGLDNRSVKGRNYPGILYVDGKLIKWSFLTALQRGINGNTTLMMGTMAQESNLVPSQVDASHFSQAAWREYLSTMFSSWTNSENVSAMIASAYHPLATINPALAKATMVSDFSVGCAFQKTAKLAANASEAPVFLFYDAFTPAEPYNFAPMSLSYHGLNYFASIHQWLFYNPHSSDLEYGSTLREQWYHLIFSAKRINSSGWRRVPRNLSQSDLSPMFLYSRPNRWPFMESHFVNEALQISSLMMNRCSVLGQLGFDERYEWAN